MEKTTLYLPSELHLALRETARRQGRSQAEVAREALERYVAAAGAPRPRSLGASAIIALLDRRDPDHASVRGAVTSDPGPWLVPAGILAEVAFMLQSRFVAGALSAFLADLEDREYTLVCGEEQLPRIRELVERYADLPLGFSDSPALSARAAGSRPSIAAISRWSGGRPRLS